MPATELLVKILGDGSQLEGAFGKVKSVVEENKSKFESWSGSVGKASLIAGGAITGVGAVALKIGEPIEKARVTLEQAIKNTGNSFEEFHGQIDKTVNKMAGLGHGSADTQTALEKLTVATNDPKKALDEMALVSELAAQKHISLADAAGMVVKQLAGGAKLAKEFGINAKESAGATKELEAATKGVEAADTASAIASQKLADVHALLAGKKKLTTAESIQLRNATDADAAAATKSDEAHARLAKAQDAVKEATKKGSVEQQEMAKLHGIAEAQAGTFGGKLAALRTHIENVAGTMASKWAPAMVQAGPLILGLGTIIESGVIPGLIGAATATWAWTAALLANPVTWIVLAIIALGVAIYELITHWSTVIKFLEEFWSTVKGLVGEGISAVLGFFARLPGEVWRFVSDMGVRVLSFLAELPAKLALMAGWAVGEYIRFWLDLPGRVWGVLMGLWGFLEAFVPMAIGWAVDLGAKILHGIWDGIVALPGLVWNLLVGGAGLLGTIAAAIPGLAGKALELGGKILSGIWDTIKDIPGKIPGMLEDVVRAILGAAGKLWDAAKHVATQIWDGFKKGLGISSPSFLERAMVEIVGGVRGHVDTLGGLVGGVNGMAVTPSLGAVPSLVSAHPAGAAALVGGGASSVTVHSHLWLDGREIADSVTTYQIQAARRNVTTSGGLI